MQISSISSNKAIVGRLIGGRADDDVLRTLDVVVFDIFLDEFDEWSAVLLGLGDAHSRAVAQLLHRAGILQGHVLERGVLEDGISWYLLARGDATAQAFELHVEGFVAGCRGAASGSHQFLLVFFGGRGVVVVGGDIEGVGILDEFVAGGSQFQYAILLHLFLHQLLEDGLPQYCLPEEFIVVV